MNPLSILENHSITNENVAETFYAIKLARKKLDELEVRIFDHVKNVEKSGQKCDNLIVKAGTFRKVVKDIRSVYKSVSDHVSNEEFMSCCSAKLGDLQDKFCETYQGTKKDAVTEFNRRLEECEGVELAQSKDGLYLIEAAVKHKFEPLAVEEVK